MFSARSSAVLASLRSLTKTGCLRLKTKVAVSAGTEPQDCPARGDPVEKGPDLAPLGSGDVGLVAGAKGLEEEPEELGALLPEVVLPDELGADQL